MKRHHRPRLRRGFTVVEMLIVVALIALVLTLAAPSFSNFILVQRLKSINSQLVTDMQFGRSEATSRNTPLRVRFQSNDSVTCYTLFVTTLAVGNTSPCSCLRGVGAACTAAGSTEVRTVVIPKSLSVTVTPDAGVAPKFAFDPATGGLLTVPSDDVSVPMASFGITTAMDAGHALKTVLSAAGRPGVCGTAPNLGASPCP